MLRDYNKLVDSLVFESGYQLADIERTDWFDFMEMLTRREQKERDEEYMSLGEIF